MYNQKPKVSVIMPVYNQEDELRLTLAGFVGQTFKDFEIVIVNDGGDRNVEQLIKSYGSKLNISYQYQENKGRAIARNECLKHVKGDYVIFSDADRIPCKQFVQEHIEKLEGNDKIVSIGNKKEIMPLYKPSIYSGQKKIIDAIKRSEILHSFIFEDSEIKSVQEKDIIDHFEETMDKIILGDTNDNFTDVRKKWGNELKDFPFPWTVATTANMGIARNNMVRAAFDTHYYGWGMEDTDFAYQLYMEGFKFTFLENALNYHQIHSRNPNYKEQLQDNVRYFCYKYNNFDTFAFAATTKNLFSLYDISCMYEDITADADKKKLLESLCKYVAFH